MVKLDTVKIAAPRESIREFDKNFFKWKQEFEKGELVKESYVYRGKMLGLSDLRIKDDELILEISSKILKEKCGELLNLDTIEEALSNICEGIKLDPAMVIEQGKLLRVDVTKDLEMDFDVPIYIQTLSVMNQNARYDAYTKLNETVCFRNKSRHISFYWKYTEMLKKGGALLKYVNPKDFERVLRMENRLNSFRIIRSSFKTENIVKEVLASGEEPNLNIYKTIRMPLPEVLLENNPETTTVTKVKNRMFYCEILRQCNYDWKQFRLIMREYCKADPYYHMKQAKKELAEMESEKFVNRFDLLDEIEQKLAG